MMDVMTNVDWLHEQREHERRRLERVVREASDVEEVRIAKDMLKQYEEGEDAL